MAWSLTGDFAAPGAPAAMAPRRASESYGQLIATAMQLPTYIVSARRLRDWQTYVEEQDSVDGRVEGSGQHTPGSRSLSGYHGDELWASLKTVSEAEWRAD